jgi:hypothetical protein
MQPKNRMNSKSSSSSSSSLFFFNDAWLVFSSLVHEPPYKNSLHSHTFRHANYPFQREL